MADKKTKEGQSIPPQALGIIGVILILAAGLIGYFGIYEPAIEEQEKAQKKNSDLLNELDGLEVQKAELAEAQKENQRLEASLDDLKAKIPSTVDELNHFLASINQRARSARITKWTLYKQEDNVTKGEVDAIPIRMEFQSSYDAAVLFFWELASMGDTGNVGNREQLINIGEVEISRLNNSTKDLSSGVQVKVTCVAETYLYTGQHEAVKK